MKMKYFTLGFIFASLLAFSVPVVADGILKTIQVAENSVKVKINGKLSEAPNYIIDGRTYLQVKDICILLNKELSWDNENKIVNINDKVLPSDILPIKDIEDSKQTAVTTPAVNPTVTPINTTPVIIPTPIPTQKILLFDQNNKQIFTDYTLYKRDGRILAPIKVLEDTLGIVSELAFDNQLIIFKDKKISLVMAINKKDVLINEKTITLDVPPLIINEQIYVPMRIVVESFGGMIKCSNLDTGESVNEWPELPLNVKVVIVK